MKSGKSFASPAPKFTVITNPHYQNQLKELERLKENVQQTRPTYPRSRTSLPEIGAVSKTSSLDTNNLATSSLKLGEALDASRHKKASLSRFMFVHSRKVSIRSDAVTSPFARGAKVVFFTAHSAGAISFENKMKRLQALTNTSESEARSLDRKNSGAL